MKYIVKYFLNEVRKYRLRKKVYCRRGVQLIGDTFFEGNNSVSYHTKLKSCKVGYGSYIGEQNDLTGVKIGRFCSIGSRINNTSGRHPTETFVSTHPAFFSTGKQAGFTYVNESKFQEFKTPVHDTTCLLHIGNDVWIGDNVLFLDGITVGDGAVIGAGSVVTKDVEPYSINVGCPAKKIRYRFTQDEITFLLNFKWWDKSSTWIKENAEKFENIRNLKERVH